MLTFSGLSAQLTLKLLDKTKPKQIESLQNEVANARAIKDFEKSAPKVNSVDDFMKDTATYTFMMKAFDLEDKIYAKALVKKALESDPSDANSLVRRLNDPNLLAMAKALDFQAGGKVNFNTLSSSWRQQMVSKFVETKFNNGQREANETVGIALKFKEKASSVSGWYGILADADLSDVMRTVLFVDPSTALADIDKQKGFFSKKYDITKLKDPAEVERLMKLYTILKDTDGSGSSSASSSPILQIMGIGSYTDITYDMSSIIGYKRGTY
jgi:hypothetical protein